MTSQPEPPEDLLPADPADQLRAAAAIFRESTRRPSRPYSADREVVVAIDRLIELVGDVAGTLLEVVADRATKPGPLVGGPGAELEVAWGEVARMSQEARDDGAKKVAAAVKPKGKAAAEGD